MSHLLLELSRKKKKKTRFRSFTEKCKPEKTRIRGYFKQFEKTYPFQNWILEETNLWYMRFAKSAGVVTRLPFLKCFFESWERLSQNRKFRFKNLGEVFRVFDLAQLTVMYDLSMACFHPVAATGVFCQKRCSSKISQFSQENTCARVSLLINLQA